MDKLNHGFTKPELLAPAGDIESFNQAIHAGADAIYLGLDGFNARIKAENFNSNNIKSVIQKAHLYGVKVYITVNILVKDDEVDEFLKLVRLALEAGADAFIVQDFGMATLLKQIYPDIVLHASTQMGIHNADGALLLKKLGFTRVVLSRETKLSDILDIKQKTELEIEFFVQGALCVAFSGNCYMSSLKNGNSGNRGLCKQLCRLNYSCDNKKGYLLSPNDLCLMENLNVLAKHGVTSFKIEGRLKRPAYVKATVESYRKIIDNNYTANFIKEQEQIAKVFTIGKYNTTAYLYDNFDIIDTKNQAHYGAKIGEVLSVAKFKDLFKITIKSDVSINEGDGLKFVGNSETSIGVGNVEVLNNNY
ncbi:MAG: U32 family peptidase, partial [Clostridia bacterium]|nr:U32 family peptidase [Clostridia bacterium]